jgi:hypothetical protein
MATTDDSYGFRGELGRLDAKGRQVWRAHLDPRLAPIGLCLDARGRVTVLGWLSGQRTSDQWVVSAFGSNGQSLFTRRFTSQVAWPIALHQSASALYVLGEVSGEVQIGGTTYANPAANADSFPAKGDALLATLDLDGKPRRAFLLVETRWSGAAALADRIALAGSTRKQTKLPDGTELGTGTFLVGLDERGKVRFHFETDVDYGSLAAATKNSFDVEWFARTRAPGRSTAASSSLYRMNSEGETRYRRALSHADVGSLLHSAGNVPVDEFGNGLLERSPATIPPSTAVPAARCSSVRDRLFANVRGERLMVSDPAYVLLDGSGRVVWRRHAGETMSSVALSLGDDGSVFEATTGKAGKGRVTRVR